MQLFSYYSMYECSEKKSVIKELKMLKNDGKIEFIIDGDILKITDIDLDESESKDLAKMLDNNDIFVDTDYVNDVNYDFDDLEDFSDDENDDIF